MKWILVDACFRCFCFLPIGLVWIWWNIFAALKHSLSRSRRASIHRSCLSIHTCVHGSVYNRESGIDSATHQMKICFWQPMPTSTAQRFGTYSNSHTYGERNATIKKEFQDENSVGQPSLFARSHKPEYF